MKASAGPSNSLTSLGSGRSTGSRDPIRTTHEKKWRDRLLARALRHLDWVWGFEDEVGWSRLAQPHLHAWTEAKTLRLGQSEPDRHALEPKTGAFCRG